MRVQDLFSTTRSIPPVSRLLDLHKNIHSVLAAKGLEPEGIVGGELAYAGELEYLVSVQGDGAHMCGGGIIGERYVLTAGHCAIDSQTNEFLDFSLSVVAGALNARKPGRDAIRVEVEKIYVYRMSEKSYYRSGDIAVLKV